MTSVIVLAFVSHFITVTALNGEEIHIAVDAIQITQAPSESLHEPGANCVIITNDAQRQVKETCEEVDAQIAEVYRKRREEELKRE